MKTTLLVAALVGLVALALFAADASAIYHPTTGRFLQRDPGPDGMMAAPRVAGGMADVGGFLPRDQYKDGMNLCQYSRSSPMVFVDPTGLAVSGTLLYDTETIHSTTAAWKAVRVDSGYAGQSVSKRSPSVIATYNPATPCCCTFTIDKYDYGVNSDIPGVGVVYVDGFLGMGKATMTATLVATDSLHEGYHRADNIAVWQEYIGGLTANRTCCYTRGLWVFERDRPQSAAKCNEHAKILTDYLASQLRDYQHAVAKEIDSRVSITSGAAATTAAHGAATAYMATMSMRDWSCDDTQHMFGDP